MTGAGCELIETPAAFLPTDVPLVQPGIDHPIALLEGPARRTEHDGEAVSDRLADPLAARRVFVVVFVLAAWGMFVLCHALSLARAMPIYEYRCADCGKRPSIFFRSLAAVEAAPACPLCGGRHLTRLISRTAQVLSEDSRLDRLSDSDLSDVDENDPKSMARWAKKMGQQMGGDELGEDFDQVVDEMGEAGPDGPSDSEDDDL
jgi:putative FmdB family regulatory protein